MLNSFWVNAAGVGGEVLATSGGIVRIKSSETAQTIEIDKPMTLESFAGPALIGVP